MVPVDLVSAVTETGITLRGDVSDLEALPLFEEAHYVWATGELPPTAPNDAPPLYWYPPVCSLPPKIEV